MIAAGCPFAADLFEPQADVDGFAAAVGKIAALVSLAVVVALAAGIAVVVDSAVAALAFTFASVGAL